MHTVADVFCMGCNDRMGWYYHKASDQTQKYKEGAHREYLQRFFAEIVSQVNTFWRERNWSRRINGRLKNNQSPSYASMWVH